jgi:hypothetical protein
LWRSFSFQELIMQNIPTSPTLVSRSGISLAPISILMDRPLLPLPTPSKPPNSPPADGATPALIMVGLDDRGKPHASWFGPDDTAKAEAAADLMDMALMEIDSDELVAIASKLPQGKLFESGKAFVPFVKRETYDRLAAYLDDDYIAASAARVKAAAAAASAGAADYAKASKGETKGRQPGDWSNLMVGDIVLASEGLDDGWWEAKIEEVLPEEQFRLRWREWPELEDFTRRIVDIALLHPKHVDA